MGSRRRWMLWVGCLAVWGSLGVGGVEGARLESRDGLPIVYLEGAPYELGYQHGQLLKERVSHSVRDVLGYFRSYLKVPLIKTVVVNAWLGSAWRQARPFIPPDYLEELRGLADGSGVPLRDLYLLHAVPDRTYACSGFAAWGRATSDGRLIHTRNLDWNIHAGIQQYAAIFVVRPDGKQAFVNAGWAGFIGVLTGINDHRISLGQIGAETLEASNRGMPMVFLMRRVMETSSTVEEAVRLMEETPRTVGVNYLLADAAAKRAVAIETTHAQLAVFEADDPREHQVSYATPMLDVVLRADPAIDPRIRDRQLASGGKPRQPGLEPPIGSAYTVRYLQQAESIRQSYGWIDVDTAQQIAQSVAPDSNVQSVVFAWPLMRVANAQGTTPAAKTAYREFNLEQLFREKNGDGSLFEN